jgi:hypothetical protein
MSQTPPSTQQESLHPFSALKPSIMDKVNFDLNITSEYSVTDLLLQPQGRPFLAASPAAPGTPGTPRGSLKRPRSNSDADSSSVICNSSSPTQLSTPSSSPQLSLSLVLESSDRSKRLRIDDTIVVATNESNTAGQYHTEKTDEVDTGEEDEAHTLLDHILSRIQPIPKLQTVSELLQNEMDAMSKNFRSQDNASSV